MRHVGRAVWAFAAYDGGLDLLLLIGGIALACRRYGGGG
jgi:hypothetical protein